MPRWTCQSCFELNPPTAERCTACGAHARKRRRRRRRMPGPRPPLLKGPSSPASRARRKRQRRVRQTVKLGVALAALLMFLFWLWPEPTVVVAPPELSVLELRPAAFGLYRDDQLDDGGLIVGGRLRLVHAESLRGVVLRAPGARELPIELREDSTFTLVVRLWPGRNDLQLAGLLADRELPIGEPLVLFRDATGRRGAELLFRGQPREAAEALSSALAVRASVRDERPLKASERREELALMELHARALAGSDQIDALAALLATGESRARELIGDSLAVPTVLRFFESCAAGLSHHGRQLLATRARQQAFDAAGHELAPALSLPRRRFAALRRLELVLAEEEGPLSSDTQLQGSLDELRAAYPDGVDDRVALQTASIAAETLGTRLLRAEDPAAAAPLLAFGATTMLSLLELVPRAETCRRALPDRLQESAAALAADGAVDAAIAQLELGARLLLGCMRLVPEETAYLAGAAALTLELAALEERAGRPERALRTYQVYTLHCRSLLRRRALSLDEGAARAEEALGRAKAAVAELRAHLQAGGGIDDRFSLLWDQAVGHFALCVAIADEVIARSPDHQPALLAACEAWAAQGQLASQTGRHDRAAACFVEEIARRRRLCEVDPRNRSHLRNLAGALREFAALRASQGLPEAAADLRAEADLVYPEE